MVLVGSEGKEDHSFFADVRVISEPSGAPKRCSARTAALADVVPPIPMRPFIEEEFRETFVEVLDAEDDNRPVTCIEVLSPSNKARGTEGRELYLRNRHGLLLGEANLVEIDLLRDGQRMPMLTPGRHPLTRFSYRGRGRSGAVWCGRLRFGTRCRSFRSRS